MTRPVDDPPEGTRSHGCPSPTWGTGAPPAVAVHIATYERSHYLPELFRALESQDLGDESFEVCIVDDDSTDDTWQVLQQLVRRCPLRVLARHLEANAGPATARNLAVSSTSAPLLAFTDDDCLPEPGWLHALVTGFADADLVQGRTDVGPPGPGCGPWARTIHIAAPSPMFETCNIGYRRTDFTAVGGFAEDDPVSARPRGQHFGEDALLGAAVVERGARWSFRTDAVVRHRRLPTTFRDHVSAQGDLADFPALSRRSQPLRSALWGGVFLSHRSAAFDLAVLAVTLAVVKRRLALLAGVLPWMTAVGPDARARSGRPASVRFMQLALVDTVAFVSLIRGSIRHRRVLL